MAIYTRIYKDWNKNWQGKTEIDLNEANRVITISTAKRSGLLTTTVSAGHKDGSFVSHTLYQDYYKTWVAMNPKRLTEKVITQQHNEVVIDMISSILADVKKFYAEKEIA